MDSKWLFRCRIFTAKNTAAELIENNKELRDYTAYTALFFVATDYSD